MAWACLAGKAHCSRHGLSAATKARFVSDSSLPRYHHGFFSTHSGRPGTAAMAVTPPPARHISSPSAARARKLALDRDVIVSVLESSATRRDAKGYLQKYANKREAVTPTSRPSSPQFFQGPQPFQQLQGALSSQQGREQLAVDEELTKVAIVKLRKPQELPDDVVAGIAKTLSQLRALGLLAIVIIDCGTRQSRRTYEHQALRLCEAIDSSFGQPVARFAEGIFLRQSRNGPLQDTRASSPIFSGNVRVDDQGMLGRALRRNKIIVVPSVARPNELSSPRPTDAHSTLLALTKYLIGMQFAPSESLATEPHASRPSRTASVERVILLDPLGGIPMVGKSSVAHRFINLEQEYTTLMEQLNDAHGSSTGPGEQAMSRKLSHAENLVLAKDALSLLPSSSSALITTPLAAANIKQQPDPSSLQLDDMVATRNRRNPLLHNLLTDRPAFSPSLPLQRIKDESHGGLQTVDASAATLVKRGMPVTILPEPRSGPWRPPEPGSPRLRLTDTSVDLPRLVHLIEDSFGRKLDVQDYLRRVNENLAGIIIAGEYEGGAILTWERPEGLDEQQAFEQGRFVPYLDKFAVLKSRQGSAGVADIVFNAMVQDCFPEGVCWRSRKNNPVNKWYSERSAGVLQLPDSNWTMFWTTAGLSVEHPMFKDYKAVCRTVQPSWADDKHILD
ncbi:Amino-acid N-acetyltransferase [Purpureocillium takamizusanense]|uniref:Amino-acid acetyltransferase, mitochondrial n=1 Tax=Purpureocillium takamizusanense TaxID=2060973 RepID=A0A9Q8QLZ6_9HYPO|nr:Amino-acid N-acetyltransferase [Purpureocillium takamizusanense]UNI22080.1 Amino-acid N-acetyltransferase [Purpureocillium takamizusanense]